MAKETGCIGVDLGGTYIKAGLVSPEGSIVKQTRVATEAERGAAHVLDRIAGCVLELAGGKEEERLIGGVGIGVPGQVDTATGKVREAPNLPGWIDLAVGRELEKRTGLRVILDNDANVAALAEYAYGAGKGCTEMLMVTLGTGVGGGLILHGEIYRGATGGAGEFGHMIVEMGGWQCGCGRLGCVEAYVGTRGILRRVGEKLGSGRKSVLEGVPEGKRTPKHVGEAAEAGDSVAREVLEEVGSVLGVGLGSVANLLNLERIVVGGGVANAGEWIMEPARRKLQETALKGSAQAVRITRAQLGEEAGITGAARLAMIRP
jgi:glucokinase